MNCKPGDMAVFVKSWAANKGKIVRCVRLATSEEIAFSRLRPNSPIWLIDRSLISKLGRSIRFAKDLQLRPITPPAGTITQSEVSDLYAPRAPERVKANSAEFVSSKERER